MAGVLAPAGREAPRVASALESASYPNEVGSTPKPGWLCGCCGPKNVGYSLLIACLNVDYSLHFHRQSVGYNLHIWY